MQYLKKKPCIFPSPICSLLPNCEKKPSLWHSTCFSSGRNGVYINEYLFMEFIHILYLGFLRMYMCHRICWHVCIYIVSGAFCKYIYILHVYDWCSFSFFVINPSSPKVTSILHTLKALFWALTLLGLIVPWISQKGNSANMYHIKDFLAGPLSPRALGTQNERFDISILLPNTRNFILYEGINTTSRPYRKVIFLEGVLLCLCFLFSCSL